LLTGGRGSLKTSSVQDFVVRLTREKGHGILFTRYTMSSAEISIIPEFKETLMRLGVEKKFQKRGKRFWNIDTGSFIHFSGIKTASGDQTGNLKSIAGITTWIIEEGEDFTDENTFDIIDDSIRSKIRQNRIIWIQNPTTQEHFIYKRFIKKYPKTKFIEEDGQTWNVTVSNHPDVEHIHTTYHIAKRLNYLSETWLKKANGHLKEAMDAENVKEGDKYFSHYYYNYIGGWLERQEGVIIRNWKKGAFNPNVPYCYGLDFGYSPDPLAIIKYGINKLKKHIYIKGLVYENEVDDEDLELYLKAYVKNKRDLIVCDNNEPKTIKRLRRNGWNAIKTKKPKGQIAQDIREINNHTIFVDETGKYGDLVTELNNWVWNDKKAGIPIGDYDHFMKAMLYAHRKMNNRRNFMRKR